MPRGGGRLAAILLLASAWLLAGLVIAPPAGAHAALVGSDPPEDARLPGAPERVTLTFSEDVGLELGYLHVVDARGARVEAGPADHPDGRGDRISVPLRPGLGEGGYVVSYAVVSADSHPVSGGYAFVVGSGPLLTASGSVADGAGTDPLVGLLFAVSRWAAYAGLALLGGLVFVATLWSDGRTAPRARAVVRLGWTLAMTGTVACLLLQGPYAARAGVGRLLSPDLLTATLHTVYGRLLALRLVALVVLGAIGVRIMRGPERPTEHARARDENVALVCGLVVVATFAGAGHASAGIQPTIALVSDMAHLTAMSVWLGGLAVLVATGPQASAALPRFSRAAFTAVAVLVATGVYQAWRGVGSIAALWETGYGRLLLAKIGGVVVLLAFANLSRRAVHRWSGVSTIPCGLARWPAGRPPTVSAAELGRRLRTAVAAEAAIASAVLAVTAVLVSTAPARETAAAKADRAAPGSVHTTIRLAGGDTARLSVSPARSGPNSVRIELSGRDGRPVRAREVDLSAALPNEQLGPLPVRLAPAGAGSYDAPTTSLPKPGIWRLVLRVRTSEFDASVGQAELAIS